MSLAKWRPITHCCIKQLRASPHTFTPSESQHSDIITKYTDAVLVKRHSESLFTRIIDAPIDAKCERTLTLCNSKYQQENIPVGCVPPAFVVTGRYLIWGVSGPGAWSGGVSCLGAGGLEPPPPCEQTDMCTNITFPQLRFKKHYLPATSFAGGN